MNLGRVESWSSCSKTFFLLCRWRSRKNIALRIHTETPLQNSRAIFQQPPSARRQHRHMKEATSRTVSDHKSPQGTEGRKGWTAAKVLTAVWADLPEDMEVEEDHQEEMWEAHVVVLQEVSLEVAMAREVEEDVATEVVETASCLEEGVVDSTGMFQSTVCLQPEMCQLPRQQSRS